jgi:hypothetical protein
MHDTSYDYSTMASLNMQKVESACTRELGARWQEPRFCGKTQSHPLYLVTSRH